MTVGYASLTSEAIDPESLRDVAPLAPFSPAAVAFVDALSRRLMDSADARAYPEITALAFWMRRSNVVRLQEKFRHETAGRLLVPRGTVFHIAPSNVDTIFIYSWALSLLCGNRNVVRLSSKRSLQAEILSAAVAALLAEPAHEATAARTILLQYAPDDAVTARLSAACDVRVIWGGDATVEQIRRIPLPATAIEVAFANKYSVAVINAPNWMGAIESERTRLVEAFWNDSYWFDQMACSSPRSVFWVGEAALVESAAADFWTRLDALLSAKGTVFPDVDYVNKLVAAEGLAAGADVSIRTGRTNSLVRVRLGAAALHPAEHCGAGLFFECRLDDLGSIRPLLSRLVQTVCYAGWSAQEMREFVQAQPLAGIDRIVPFGQALNFAPVWDGFDLTHVFMREITVT